MAIVQLRCQLMSLQPRKLSDRFLHFSRGKFEHMFSD